MAVFYHIVALLGGLAMFLYGMRVMGEGLKSNSGGAMQSVLAKVTNKPVLGFLLGVLVTCIIQSSTATIVLTVGLVGAGFLTFRQSTGIVLGANVGTAITAQVIRLMDVQSGQDSILYFFKADNLAPMALILGITILMTTKRASQKNIGNVACGFGVLFMGLIFMSDAVSLFGESLSNLLTAFSNNYFMGFLAGVITTGVIQSSSAVVGIIQSIASSVGVQFCGVFAVIIGVNIGDCLTTFLVSRIGARPEQIRTATVHVVYNIFAAILIIILVMIGKSTGLLNGIWDKTLDSGGVANVHGLFRLVPAVVLLPFNGVLAKITESIVKEKPETINAEDAVVVDALKKLDPLLLASPIMALDQVDNLLVHMAQTAYRNYNACSQQIYNFEEARKQRIDERESLLDRITDAIGQYLIQMTPNIKRDRDFRTQNYELKTSICFERIGDLSVKLTSAVAAMQESGKSMSAAALREIQIMLDAVDEILTLTMAAFKTKDADLAKKIEPLEEVVDDLGVDLNSRHVARMAQNQCDAYLGIQYQNIIDYLEGISDQCSDISVYIIEMQQTDIQGHEHEYIDQLHRSVDSDFQENYKILREKYYSRLKSGV